MRPELQLALWHEARVHDGKLPWQLHWPGAVEDFSRHPAERFRQDKKPRAGRFQVGQETEMRIRRGAVNAF